MIKKLLRTEIKNRDIGIKRKIDSYFEGTNLLIDHVGNLYTTESHFPPKLTN